MMMIITTPKKVSLVTILESPAPVVKRPLPLSRRGVFFVLWQVNPLCVGAGSPLTGIESHPTKDQTFYGE